MSGAPDAGMGLTASEQKLVEEVVQEVYRGAGKQAKLKLLSLMGDQQLTTKHLSEKMMTEMKVGGRPELHKAMVMSIHERLDVVKGEAGFEARSKSTMTPDERVLVEKAVTKVHGSIGKSVKETLLREMEQRGLCISQITVPVLEDMRLPGRHALYAELVTVLSGIGQEDLQRPLEADRQNGTEENEEESSAVSPIEQGGAEQGKVEVVDDTPLKEGGDDNEYDC
mmetsp:Transcript_8655/g.15570  ORF Transcript_8655/g.15570 Transcript_8655/m.15570 type:complete len:225 (-) Transcript_8655:56-730(-)